MDKKKNEEGGREMMFADTLYYIKSCGDRLKVIHPNKTWYDLCNDRNIIIYITGTPGPQGKSTLKKMFVDAGYKRVMELEDVMYQAFDDPDFDEKKMDSFYSERAKEEGFLFDFGTFDIKGRNLEP